MPPQIVTVAGPIDPARLGVTDAHDHLFLRSPALAGQEIEDLDRVTLEVAEAAASGVGAIVELTPIGLGRRPDLMRAVSKATGVHVVAATGYHRDVHYAPGHWVLEASEDVLLERVLSDIQHGMHPADWHDPALPPDVARAGVIKAGASYHRPTRDERRRLVAAGEAARKTGLAVVAHCEIGTAANEIIELLASTGLPPRRIVLAHMDRNPDAELHIGLAERGVNLVYDTIGRIKYRPDSELLALIETVGGAGFVGQIMLGLDLGKGEGFRAFDGGPGLRYLMRTFVPRLRKRIGEAAVSQLLVANPARIYAVGE